MRSEIKIFNLFLIGFHMNVLAIDTKSEEIICSEIGFKKKTELHAECVLELIERKNKDSIDKSFTTNSSTSLSDQKTISQGDGTPEHAACEKFGFRIGTTGYSDCRMKMEIAKQDAQQMQAAYELDLRKYQEQVARYEKEKQRQKDDALLRFGLSLIGGTSPHFSENLANAGRASIGLPPIAPSSPQIQNFTIMTPSGRLTNCTVMGNSINCF